MIYHILYTLFIFLLFQNNQYPLFVLNLFTELAVVVRQCLMKGRQEAFSSSGPRPLSFLSNSLFIHIFFRVWGGVDDEGGK